MREQEYRPGVPPIEAAKGDPKANLEDAEWRTILGLEEAMAATQRSLAEHADPVHQEHLADLRAQLIGRINESIQMTKSKIQTTEANKGNASSLKWHLNNLYGKLAAAEGKPEQHRAA